MSDIIEGIGTAIEGSLIGSAVEPKDGKVPMDATESGLQTGQECLNCGTVLLGAHCHSCGQKAHVHRTITGFMHDLLHGALHFEGKIWKTLPKLIFKPGELTRRYIEGERAHFVSPMALFLFAIFLMFAVFQFAGIGAPADLEATEGNRFSDRVMLKNEELQTRIAAIDQTLETGSLAVEKVIELEATRSALAKQLEDLQFVGGITGASDSGNSEGLIPTQPNEDGSTSIPVRFSNDGPQGNLAIGNFDWLKGAIQKWENNPSLMLYKLQSNFYKFSWLMIPLSIPFVWLMFAWKRQFKAYDHAIFVTYSLSFMTMLILSIVMIGLLGAHPLVIVGSTLLIPPIHLYRQLRGAYGLSRLSSLWRLGAMLIFITIVLVLFLQALLVLGAL